ncbi:unnamed protein product [Closterium sp. Yama58-4]|nr:unnamed protein product [Closterium sp. Yama58-4]
MSAVRGQPVVQARGDYGTHNGLLSGPCGVWTALVLPLVSLIRPISYLSALPFSPRRRVRCVDSQWCKDAEITVPITDFCPGGGVCCATCTHFDLSQPAFGIIADPVAGVIPLAYQRVPCSFPTSITFRVTGTNYWMNVLLLRVGGPGEVALVEVSSKNDPNWRPLTHDWGTNWVSWSYIEGPLKFRLTSGMDGAVITTGENCVPAIYPGDYTCGAQFTSGYNSSDTNGDGGSNSSVGNSTDQQPPLEQPPLEQPPLALQPLQQPPLPQLPLPQLLELKAPPSEEAALLVATPPPVLPMLTCPLPRQHPLLLPPAARSMRVAAVPAVKAVKEVKAVKAAAAAVAAAAAAAAVAAVATSMIPPSPQPSSPLKPEKTFL